MKVFHSKDKNLFCIIHDEPQSPTPWQPEERLLFDDEVSYGEKGFDVLIANATHLKNDGFVKVLFLGLQNQIFAVKPSEDRSAFAAREEKYSIDHEKWREEHFIALRVLDA